MKIQIWSIFHKQIFVKQIFVQNKTFQIKQHLHSTKSFVLFRVKIQEKIDRLSSRCLALLRKRIKNNLKRKLKQYSQQSTKQIFDFKIY